MLFRSKTHKTYFDIFERNGKKVIKNKYLDIDVTPKNPLQTEKKRFHNGNIDINKNSSEYIFTSFIIDGIEFTRRNTKLNNNDVIANPGDSNNIFLISCLKDGICVNISDPAVISFNRRVMEIVKDHIEYIHYKNNAIHLHKFDTGRPLFQHHIFEFNQKNFLIIIANIYFQLGSDIIAMVLDETVTFFDRFVFYLWDRFFENDAFCRCFKKYIFVSYPRNRTKFTEVMLR